MLRCLNFVKKNCIDLLHRFWCKSIDSLITVLFFPKMTMTMGSVHNQYQCFLDQMFILDLYTFLPNDVVVFCIADVKSYFQDHVASFTSTPSLAQKRRSQSTSDSQTSVSCSRELAWTSLSKTKRCVFLLHLQVKSSLLHLYSTLTI